MLDSTNETWKFVHLNPVWNLHLFLFLWWWKLFGDPNYKRNVILTLSWYIKWRYFYSWSPDYPPENLQCQRSWDLKENKFEGKKIIVHENEQPLFLQPQKLPLLLIHTGCHSSESRIGLARVALWCQLWNELNATSTSNPRTNYRLGDDQLYLKICVKIVLEMFFFAFKTLLPYLFQTW